MIWVLMLGALASKDCSADTDQCQEESLSFFDCRETLLNFVQPLKFLTKSNVQYLDTMYQSGLWDLSASCNSARLQELLAADTTPPTARRCAFVCEEVLADPKMTAASLNKYAKLGIPSPSSVETENIASALQMLKLPDNLYMAGFPNFPRNFVRDSVIAAILFRDKDMLIAQLRFAMKRQGKRRDPSNGEEPGKMFHEFPGFPIRLAMTDYNACDATALFIIGCYQAVLWDAGVEELEGNEQILVSSALWQELRPAVERAINDYIIKHVDQSSGLFFEDPSLADATEFGLQVTYWKDSKLFGTHHTFPVVYSLAHIQNYRAIKLASQLMPSEKLIGLADKMQHALRLLISPTTGMFYVSASVDGSAPPQTGVSSDSLTALYFLDPSDLPSGAAKAIEKASMPLETLVGYATETLVGLAPELQPVRYHLNTVWPFEQALIHAGAVKHNLHLAPLVAQRVQRILLDESGRFPELVRVEEMTGTGTGYQAVFMGCSPQLWSIAAAKYFMDNA